MVERCNSSYLICWNTPSKRRCDENFSGKSCCNKCGFQSPGISCFTAGNKNEVLACWFQNGLFNYTVQVRAVNSCGQGGLRYKNFYVDNCFYYSVSLSPNPAQGTVNIELTETPFDETGKAMLQPENRHRREYQEYSFDSHPSRIRIFDINGVE